MPHPHTLHFQHLKWNRAAKDLQAGPTVIVLRQRRFSFLTMSKTAALGKQFRAFGPIYPVRGGRHGAR
jgi:hypothetical protein